MLPFVAPDNEGTEFIFAFGSNHRNDDGYLEVFVTTKSVLPVEFNYTVGNETQVKWYCVASKKQSKESAVRSFNNVHTRILRCPYVLVQEQFLSF